MENTTKQPKEDYLGSTKTVLRSIEELQESLQQLRKQHTKRMSAHDIAECRKRMASYSPEKRAELEKYAQEYFYKNEKEK